MMTTTGAVFVFSIFESTIAGRRRAGQQLLIVEHQSGSEENLLVEGKTLDLGTTQSAVRTPIGAFASVVQFRVSARRPLPSGSPI